MRSAKSQRGPSDIDEICCDEYKPLRRLIGKVRAARSRAPLLKGIIPQGPGVGATHTIAHEELGISADNETSDLGHFINHAALDCMYAASEETPGVHHHWLYDLEFPNQVHDGMYGGMNWDTTVGMDDLKPLT